MTVFLKYTVFFSFFIISCAQRVDLGQEGDTIIYNKSTAGDQKSNYMSCSLFADKTFQGYVWDNVDSSSSKSDCVHVKITKYPQELLKNEDLFLQIYPFFIKNGEMRYDESLSIETLTKDQKKALVLSKLIDTYLIEKELKLNPDHFFADHILEICNIKEDWNGLQLVIYERRPDQKSVPIRVTKFLLPPFLVHPELFRETRGDALAAFHPFLSFINEFKSKPSSYYDLAKKMCQSI